MSQRSTRAARRDESSRGKGRPPTGSNSAAGTEERAPPTPTVITPPMENPHGDGADSTPTPLRGRSPQVGPGPEGCAAKACQGEPGGSAGAGHAVARAGTAEESAPAPAAVSGAGLAASAMADAGGPAAGQEGAGVEPVLAEEAEVAASPSPVEASAIAEVVAVAARGGAEVQAVGDSVGAAAPVGTNAADVGGDSRVRGQTTGHGTGAASSAPGNYGRKLRAQPAPRRLGSGLGPGSPGPLLGWLRQGQPQPERVGRAASRSRQETGGPAREGDDPARIEVVQPAVATASAAAARVETPLAGDSVARNTRHATRRAAITWGPPRGGRTPWLPAGQGQSGAAGVPTGVGGRQRGGGTGGRRRGRGGRALVRGVEIPDRVGTWRERHDRPETTVAPTNEETGGSDNAAVDPGFMSEEEAESEEVSLHEEAGVDRNTSNIRGRVSGGNTQNPRATEAPAGRPEGLDVFSPSDLANDDAIWQAAGGWEVTQLQRVDQPRMEDSLISAEADASTCSRTCQWKSLDWD
ncbi:unnamed protein product [Closterium sp. Naga37s-1]|nr:unnamed protein product [Closterium sp. Naga37s-1]